MNTNVIQLTPRQINEMDKIIDEVIDEVKTPKPGSLDNYKLKRLFEYKLISKSVYIQLALAHDFGVGTIPNYSDWKKWLEKWQVEDKLNFGDVMEGLTKVYKNFYKNDNDQAPVLQLNLFEMIANEHP